MDKEKKLFKVGVTYSVYGFVYVEAEDEFDALDVANNSDLALSDVHNAEYLEDSWEADSAFVAEVVRK